MRRPESWCLLFRLGPIKYHTAEGQDIRVVVLVPGLKRPWSLAFLPSGEMLVTERGGQLRIVRDGVLDPQPIEGVPDVRAAGLSGLFDIALHPKFEKKPYVYLTYNKPVAGGAVLGLARGTWKGGALTDVRDIFVSDNTTSSVSRLAFGRDGTLYVTTFGSRATMRRTRNATRAKCCVCATTARCPTTIRSWAKRATSPKSSRWATAARSASPSIR